MTILTQNKYTIEYRVFHDTTWYQGYFKNMQPKWGPWQKWGVYNDLTELTDESNRLEIKKPYLKYKTEYRIIKNGKSE